MALRDRWYMQEREAQGEAWRRYRPRERVVRIDPLVRSRGEASRSEWNRIFGLRVACIAVGGSVGLAAFWYLGRSCEVGEGGDWLACDLREGRYVLQGVIGSLMELAEFWTW